MTTTVPATRLHYLDWLRVLALVGVFLYHSVRPFDLTDWHIKNAELSFPLTGVLIFVGLWGMPFFFLIAGAGARFALAHRSGQQFLVERLQRLLLPYLVGCLLLTPIMLYTEWSHKIQSGKLTTSFMEFVGSRSIPLSPEIFGWAGYHLWFLGFLFAFSLFGLLIFRWLARKRGQRFTAWLAGLCLHRGGILLPIIPLLIVQLALRLFFYEGEHNWADFFFLMVFFIFGYLLYSDERFTQAIRRDWWLILLVAITAAVVIIAALVGFDAYNWVSMPWHPGFYIAWTLVVINAWCWTLLMLAVGIRFLNFSNRWLNYAQEATLPFFLFHQPVIMILAYFVVQWDAAILPKLLTILTGTLVLTLGLYILLIRRIKVLRLIFGVKPMRVQSRAAPST